MTLLARLAAPLVLVTIPLRALAVLPTVPSVSPAAAPAGGGAALVQTVASVLLVVGIIFGCAWLARRFGLQRLGGCGIVKVVASAPLGQRERVVVVEVPGGTWLVLGVTPTQVNPLHSMPAQPLPEAGNAAPNSLRMVQQFSTRLQEALGKR
jgi:flagellar protein FliO/FliZ